MSLVAADVAGTWYMNASGYRLVVTISGAGPFTGTCADEGAAALALSDISINGDWLEFRRNGNGFWQWYRVRVVGGVFQGRYSTSYTSSVKPDLSAYQTHATAWNGSAINSVSPVAFELLINNKFLARLRIDKTPAGALVGRMKVYATTTSGSASEEVEYDVSVSTWNGTNLVFTRNVPGSTQVYTGTVSGRSVSGTFKVNGSHQTSPWSGKRAEVIGYGVAGGLTSTAATARLDAMRARLALLTMDGNPVGTIVSQTRVAATIPNDGNPIPADRDDNPTAITQAYTFEEWTRTYEIANPFDGSVIQRTVHGYIATPTTPPPASGKYRTAISVNGHGGSAWLTMDKSTLYWAGDGFACHNYVVVSVDISHRNDSPVYGTDWSSGGDDPPHGNGPHPSIRTLQLDTAWEEDGERAWDTARAVDFALEQANVDPDRLIITGISMGGEVSTIAAAMDTRIKASVPSGYSPDMCVLTRHGNHSCWMWARADIREYVDISDYEALIAPRPLVVETGKQDGTFSSFSPPYAADKQVLRRARMTYADLGASSNIAHYLHYDIHQYHVGDVSQSHPTPTEVQVPTKIAPSPPGDTTWQTDGNTSTLSPTLFALVDSLLP